MTLVGVFGIILGLLAFPVAVESRTRLRVGVFALAYLLHVAAAITFYFYSLTNLSDSTTYYNDPLGFYREGFGLTTQLIFWIVQTGRAWFGGTFLDYFLVFQAFGFFGIAYVMRIFEEIHSELELHQPLYTYLILFLPGLHFWTSSIGKDGIIFSGICMSLWAAMRPRKRLIWLGVGVAIAMVIRPHVALIMTAALSGALFFDRGSRWYVRVGLILAAVVGMGVAAATVQSSFRLDVTSADSVGDFLAYHTEVVQSTGTDAGGVSSGSLPAKFLSLMFRPMFLDAEGAFGLVASFENVALLLIVIALLAGIGKTLRAARALTFIRYSLLLALGISMLLTLVYYNVGLGLRQKTMFVPALLVMFVTVRALVRRAFMMREAAEAAAARAVRLKQTAPPPHPAHPAQPLPG